jgi:CRP/FNR family cyclic AMP-dependent transcriptional regulator
LFLRTFGGRIAGEPEWDGQRGVRRAALASILEYCDGAAQLAFDAGAELLSEGRKTNRLYVLIEGAVGISRDGVEVAQVSEPGAIFGEMSLLLDLPHTATVKALTAGRAYELEDAKTFLRSRPDTALFLAELLAERLNEATTTLVDLKQQFQAHAERLTNVRWILEGLPRRRGGAD